MPETVRAVLGQIFLFCWQYPTQLLAAYLLLVFRFERRRFFWVTFPALSAFFLSLPYWVGYYPPWLTVGGWFTLSFFMYFVLCGLIMWLCFRISWKQALFFATAAYAMQNCISEASKVLRALVPLRGLAASALSAALAAALLALFYFLFSRRIPRAEESERFAVKDSNLIVLSVITVAIVYVLSMYASHIQWVDVLRSIYAVCCCLFLLLFQFGLFEKGKEEEKNRQIRRLLALSNEQHRLSRENIEIINMKCHDLKHQIADLRSMTDDQRREARLREIEKAVMIYDSFVKTGCAPLDVLLTEKSLVCERYGITFSCIVEAAGLSFIEDEDYCSLFGNALDNAIESVKMAPPERRLISLSVRAHGQVLVVHTENYCAVKPVFRGGLPETTKKDGQYHGFGLRSILYIAEKYGGTMRAHVEKDMFHLNVLIPMPDTCRAEGETPAAREAGG